MIVLPIAILTGLALPERAVLQKDAIRARGYAFSIARTCRYADARRMTVIEGFRRRDGKLVRRAGIGTRAPRLCTGRRHCGTPCDSRRVQKHSRNQTANRGE